MTNRCKNVFTISRGVAEPTSLNTLALRPECARIGIRDWVAGPTLNALHPAPHHEAVPGPSSHQSEQAALIGSGPETPLGHDPSAASIRPRVATAAC